MPFLLLGGEGETAIGLDEMAAWFGMTPLDAALALSGRLPAHYRDSARKAGERTPLPSEALR